MMITKGSHFRAWVLNARPGDSVVYHEGAHVLVGDGSEAKIRVAELAWRAAAAGMVFLFQKRLSPNTMQYCALRLSDRAGDALKLNDPTMGETFDDGTDE